MAQTHPEPRYDGAAVAGYRTQRLELMIGPMSISLLIPADVDAVLDGEDDPYWAEVWNSSLALSQHLADDPDLDGMSLLELGCGVGLAGIVASKIGAHVLLTDYNRDALAFARHNLQINECQTARVQYLDWYTPNLTERFDAILAADVIYDATNWEFLLCLWQKRLKPGGHVLLSEPGRLNAPPFFERAAEQGFTWTQQHREIRHEGRTYGVDIYGMYYEP